MVSAPESGEVRDPIPVMVAVEERRQLGGGTILLGQRRGRGGYAHRLWMVMGQQVITMLFLRL